MALIRLRTAAGTYLSSRDASEIRPLHAAATHSTESELFWLTTPNNRPRSGEIASLMTYRMQLEGTFQRAANDRHVSLIDSRGRSSQRLYARYRGPGEIGNPAGDGFIITRLNNNGKPLVDGDRIALRFYEDTRTPGYLSANSGGVQLRSMESPGVTETFTVEMMSDLKLFWNEARRDNFSTATPSGYGDAEGAGYAFIRAQGRLYLNPAPGRIPLYLYWNRERGDNLLTTEKEGEADALRDGYVKIRLEGYILEKPNPNAIPLRTYWRGAERNDSFSTTSIAEEQSAADATYQFVREEGYVLPIYTAISAGSATISLPTPGGIRIDKDILPPLKIDPKLRIDKDLIDIRFPRRRRQANKKALVLSGGGAKGCFEVGAVQYLWEQGYRPDIICGVSVGALNGAKLAEGRDTSASDLKAIWEQMRPVREGGQGGGAIYSKDYFVELLTKWISNMAVDVLDDVVDVGTDIIGDWISYAASHFYAIHSMHPLRTLIHDHLNISAIRRSAIQLRIGITDIQTGQYFSVTEPFARTALGLNLCGRIELEPDHRMGENWLTRPVLGADAYAMFLEDAIYASCVLPVFMDPKIINLAQTLSVPYQGERIAVLKTRGTLDSTYSPPPIEHLMSITRNGTRPMDGSLFTDLKNARTPNYDTGHVLREGMDAMRGDSRMSQFHLFDGGLRDTMAIRTAMRLGAREIIVITGDRLQSTPWSFKNPGTLHDDLFALPVAQYLFGLLGIWFNEAARTDMLVGVAQNEFLGWLYRCYTLLEPDKRQQLVREFNDYWRTHGSVMQNVLGGSSWIGGNTIESYGTPFQDEGCSIQYVAPTSDLLGALEFENWDGIQDGITMGYEAAHSPMELSFPVPESHLD